MTNASKVYLLLAASALGAALFHFWPQAPAAAPASAPPPTRVSLVTAQVKPLPLRLITQGHVVSLNQVDVQAQLTGTVKSVAFNEGDFVRQGQLLFTLEDSSQQATLRHAIAAQGEAKALLNKAQRDVDRSRALRAKNYLSASDWDIFRRQAAITPAAEESMLQIADLTLDFLRHRVARAGNRIELTQKEFLLLSLLMRRTGEVLSRTVLAEQVWDMNFDPETNVIDVAIRRLRNKIDDGYAPKLLHTIRGAGYVLEERDDADTP